MIDFPTAILSIEDRVNSVDPVQYASSRNYKNGALTYLGPYVSRGVISTKSVFKFIERLSLSWEQTEKLTQELAWRDYWQRVWQIEKKRIETDLKRTQRPILNYEIPRAVIDANTGIDAVDKAVEQLYKTGYMHNHMRMYVASICCNIGKSHWLEPAKWMYSHLLDGDLASNYLSWQWVAGTFSNKKYFANQDNINKYFESNQKQTFLDVDYKRFEHMAVPEQLIETCLPESTLVLPDKEQPVLEKHKTSLVYNYYNIDPYWHLNEEVQRIFLIEPSFYRNYPVDQKCLQFALDLCENIKGIQVFVGEFSALKQVLGNATIIFKEHPTNGNYQGIEESRDWMTSVEGHFPSFFSFWKQCKKELQ